MSKFTSCFADLMESFIAFKEAHGYLRRTYQGCLTDFDAFCAEKCIGEATLTKELVMAWAVKREDESTYTLCTRAGMIRQFGKYLASVGITAYITPDNFFGGRSSFMPYIFSDKELSSLFTAIDCVKPSRVNPFKPMIAAVLFRLIYTCGLRPNEGRELKRSSINMVTGEILITGTKEYKERIVVMSDDMLELCKRYDEKRKFFSNGSEYFFADGTGQAYLNTWVLKLFKSCWQRANPTFPKDELPNVRVYDLRHRFATATLHRWLDEGRDIYAMLPYLRTYMGHANFNETAYYIHLLPENLVKSAGIDWVHLSEIIPDFNESDILHEDGEAEASI